MRKAFAKRLTKHHIAFQKWLGSEGYSPDYVRQVSQWLAGDHHSVDQRRRARKKWDEFCRVDDRFVGCDPKRRIELSMQHERKKTLASKAELKRFRTWMIESEGYSHQYARQQAIALKDVENVNNPRANSFFTRFQAHGSAPETNPMTARESLDLVGKVLASDMDPKTKQQIIAVITTDKSQK